MNPTFLKADLNDIEKIVLRCFSEDRPQNFLTLLNQYRKITATELQDLDELSLNYQILDLLVALKFLLDNLFVEFYFDICFSLSVDSYIITTKGKQAL